MEPVCQDAPFVPEKIVFCIDTCAEMGLKDSAMTRPRLAYVVQAVYSFATLKAKMSRQHQFGLMVARGADARWVSFSPSGSHFTASPDVLLTHLRTLAPDHRADTSSFNLSTMLDLLAADIAPDTAPPSSPPAACPPTANPPPSTHPAACASPFPPLPSSPSFPRAFPPLPQAAAQPERPVLSPSASAPAPARALPALSIQSEAPKPPSSPAPPLGLIIGLSAAVPCVPAHAHARALAAHTPARTPAALLPLPLYASAHALELALHGPAPAATPTGGACPNTSAPGAVSSDAPPSFPPPTQSAPLPTSTQDAQAAETAATAAVRAHTPPPQLAHTPASTRAVSSAPCHTVRRLIWVYGRSCTLPLVDGRMPLCDLPASHRHAHLLAHPHCFLDVVFMHQVDGARASWKDVFASMNVSRLFPKMYLFEVAADLQALFRAFALLLAHPLQRA